MEEHLENLNVGGEQLPNSSAALVLGILSVVCICCGVGAVVGIVLGILAVVYAKKARTFYNESPEKFTESSVKNANAGRICGIVGLCMGGVWFLVALSVWILMLLGIIASTRMHF